VCMRVCVCACIRACIHVYTLEVTCIDEVRSQIFERFNQKKTRTYVRTWVSSNPTKSVDTVIIVSHHSIAHGLASYQSYRCQCSSSKNNQKLFIFQVSCGCRGRFSGEELNYQDREREIELGCISVLVFPKLSILWCQQVHALSSRVSKFVN